MPGEIISERRARSNRNGGRHHRGFAGDFPRNPQIYEYGLLDEYAINAYWIGRYDECLKSCRKILSTATLSDAERKRIQANADFAKQKLSGG